MLVWGYFRLMSLFWNMLTAGGKVYTLTLNTLSSIDFDFVGPPWDSTAGVRVLRNGTIEEIFADSWTAQNSGVEWIDNNASDIGDSYEVFLTGTGNNPTSGPALDAWHTISSTQTWLLANAIEADVQFTGTMTIREIADTGNSVSAGVTLTANNGPA